MTDTKQPDRQQPRRRLLRALAAGGSVFATGKMLPGEWTRPVVNNVLLPAHAQTSPFEGPVGEFGAAVSAIGSNERGGSVLDLFVQSAHAAPAAVVGSVSFTAFWTVLENSAQICGTANHPNSTTVLLNGSVSRSGNSLDDFSRIVGPTTLEFTNQEVSSGGVSLDASADDENLPFIAPPGPGCSNLTSLQDSSSPYADDEEIV